ncbi:MAG: bifunctional adenosylcobinamide kinase/adenosylcobinamide-phosphate guanylyltransferase [Dehalococcoidia bacterium]
MTVTFVTGGARSGKSAFAERVAAESGLPVVYIATMQPGDDELVARVARHRARRPAHWRTVEAPLELAAAIRDAPPGELLLVDCLSLWVANVIFAAVPDPEADAATFEAAIDRCLELGREAAEALGARPGPAVIVTNEAGSGIVPAGALSRYYRDALGLVNQQFAAAADEAFVLISGMPLRLKPGA